MSDLMMLLKLLIGQKFSGVTEDGKGYIHLHFEDFVIIAKELYPTPIIERIA